MKAMTSSPISGITDYKMPTFKAPQLALGVHPISNELSSSASREQLQGLVRIRSGWYGWRLKQAARIELLEGHRLGALARPHGRKALCEPILAPVASSRQSGKAPLRNMPHRDRLHHSWTSKLGAPGG